MAIDKMKTLLGISADDHSRDDLLLEIESITADRLKSLIGGVDTVPDSLAYIVTEVGIRRFNRIGSEGLSSHTVEGETMAWSEDDFSEYETDIANYLEQKAEVKRGKVRFL